MGVDVAFWVFAVVGVVAALGVVVVKNLFRAALMLVLCFFTVAGIYGSLSADFLMVAQVLVYMGAISVLIIFAVMLTRDVQRGNPFNRAWPWAFTIAVLLMGLLIFVFADTVWPIENHTYTVADLAVPTGSSVDGSVNLVAEGEATTSAVAQSIFDKDFGFLLPFEISATLILAAVIGAIALVRER